MVLSVIVILGSAFLAACLAAGVETEGDVHNPAVCHIN